MTEQQVFNLLQLLCNSDGLQILGILTKRATFSQTDLDWGKTHDTKAFLTARLPRLV